MTRASFAGHGLVLVLTIAVVVGGAAGAGALSGGVAEPREPLAVPEYDPGATVLTPGPRTGDVPMPSASGGAVLVDAGHDNRFTRASIEPIVGTLAAAGVEVQFYTEGDLLTQLRDVDAYLVVDPGEEYLEGDVDDVEAFTDDGGRLVVLAEPTRIGTRGAQESAVTSLVSSYGMSVDTRYLYQLDGGGASYKHVAAAPAAGSPLGGVEETRLYIAAPVRATHGTTLLWSRPGTRLTGSDEAGAFPVAVQRNNALVVGDSSFASASQHAVADNEALVGYVVEFLAGGDAATAEPPAANASGESGA